MVDFDKDIEETFGLSSLLPRSLNVTRSPNGGRNMNKCWISNMKMNRKRSPRCLILTPSRPVANVLRFHTLIPTYNNSPDYHPFWLHFHFNWHLFIRSPSLFTVQTPRTGIHVKGLAGVLWLRNHYGWDIQHNSKPITTPFHGDQKDPPRHDGNTITFPPTICKYTYLGVNGEKINTCPFDTTPSGQASHL